MRTRTCSAALAAVAAAGLLAIGPGAAGASPATVPGPPALPSLGPYAGTFVPPSVGPISVDIGRTIINGQITDPGLHVLMPGVSVPLGGTTPR
jgi:hypothetical protein